MRRYTSFVIILGIIVPQAGFSQQISKKELRLKVREYRQAHEHQLLDELVEWLSIPNVAADKVNIRRCAEWLKTAMEKRGITESEARELHGRLLPLINLENHGFVRYMLRRRGVLTSSFERAPSPLIDDGDKREITTLLQAVNEEINAFPFGDE